MVYWFVYYELAKKLSNNCIFYMFIFFLRGIVILLKSPLRECSVGKMLIVENKVN